MPGRPVKVAQTKLNLLEKFYLPGILVGLTVTARHFFRNLLRPSKVVTIRYPEEKRHISPRWRGKHRLMVRPDGELACVACMMCATACPALCIEIEAEEHPDPRVEKVAKSYTVDFIRCVECGLCAEACPVDAVRLDSGVTAVAVDDRAQTLYDKEHLMSFWQEQKRD
jgi:NADH-quinone oxidoreductase subunit I